MSAPTPDKDCTGAALPETAAVAEPCLLRRLGLKPTGMKTVRRKLGGEVRELRVWSADHVPSNDEGFAVTGGRAYIENGHTECRYDLCVEADGTPAAVRVKLQRLRFWDEETGKYKSVTCRPRGFDEEIKVSRDLIKLIEGRFASSTLKRLEYETGVRYWKLCKIDDCILEKNNETLLTSDFAPDYIAVDIVFLSDKVGGRGACITVVAVQRGLRPVEIGSVFLWQEEEYHDSKGKKKKRRVKKPEGAVIAELAAIYASVPSIDRLKGVAMDGEKWLARIDRAARKRASKTHQGLDKVAQVGDPWHFAHNVKKPFKALITSDRKNLPRGKKGAAERDLLKRFYHYLVHACWHDLANKPEALEGVTALLERFPDWREPFWVVKHFLYVQAAPDLPTAKERFEDWQARLTDDLRCFFRAAINHISDNEEAFLAYFEIKEHTGLSVTSSPVESRHKKKKDYWRNARRAGQKLHQAKAAADAGIATQLKRAELERLWKQDRKRKKRQREAKLKTRAALKGEESASLVLAA